MSEEKNTHPMINSVAMLAGLAIAIAGGIYQSGQLSAHIDENTRSIEKIEERPITDTTEIEKTVSVLLSKVENLAGNADTVQSVKEDVIKLKVEVEKLTSNINGIPNEFPTLKQKVDQLAAAFDKLEEKQGAASK